MVSPEDEQFALAEVDDRVESITQATGRLCQGVQHLLQIEGRAADDLQDISGRGLLLQGFAQFPEQSCILDSDHRLLREIAEQFDLLVSKRADLLSIDPDCADQFGVPKHRYNDKRPGASEIR